MTRTKGKGRGKPKARQAPPLTDSQRWMATVIAMHIRNNLEELHGGGNRLDHTDEGGEDEGLTDEQMRWINPIVRNSVADVLHALANYEDCQPARDLISFCEVLVPGYWEPAELTEDYRESDWSKPLGPGLGNRLTAMTVRDRPAEAGKPHDR
jgi:hypothetical protein